jgi:hypothetical protein
MKKRWWLLLLLLIPWAFYAVYSFAQTDPNLVLFQSPLFLKFQETMWQIGYHNRELSVRLYIGIVVLLFLSWISALKLLQKNERILYFAGCIIILFFSYPALSHDIFNYMFNAKMYLKYGLNPHTHVALEASSDDWLRFMHNTHTAAPYGYGWTILSFLPALAGGMKFTSTLLAFRLFITGAFLGLVVVMRKLLTLLKKSPKNVWYFALNPLVLLETVGTLHNDVWMIFFLFGAIYTAVLGWQKKKLLYYLLAIALFALSVSIKYATIVILPAVFLFLLARFSKKLSFLQTYFWEGAAVLLFIPLLTLRSQYFHPWYLIWALSMLPFVTIRFVRYFLFAFSFSSLMRYVPYFSIGDFRDGVLASQQRVTWVGGVGILCVLILWELIRRCACHISKK